MCIRDRSLSAWVSIFQSGSRPKNPFTADFFRVARDFFLVPAGIFSDKYSSVIAFYHSPSRDPQGLFFGFAGCNEGNVGNNPLMDVLSNHQRFPELFCSHRFIQAGIPGMDSILGEIR